MINFQPMSQSTATLLISCPDSPGLVAKIANFIYANGGNIIHADQHTDCATSLFLIRIEWQLEGFNLPRSAIATAFSAIAKPLNATWQLHFADTVPRIAIWVTKQDHCLWDLLWRHQARELPGEIALIISNHPHLKAIAEQFNLDFHHLPISQETKAEQEAKQLQLLREYQIDLAKPYHRAHARGVKIIGATAHYVTQDLDEGPIIEQEVVRVNHQDTVKDLIRKGKDLERLVLSRAVRLHLQHRVLIYDNKTVVFS